MAPAFGDLNKETEIEANNTMTIELKHQTSFSSYGQSQITIFLSLGFYLHSSILRNKNP